MKAPNWLKRLVTASSRAADADTFPHQRTYGIGQDWAPPEYGEYFATSPAIYAAIRVRTSALTRAPLTVRGPGAQGASLPPTHPLVRLLALPNPDMVTADLITAIETNLCLWGRAYLSIEPMDGRTELWPLRPDRLATVPGTGNTYIKGYIYRSATGKEMPYLPEEIVSFTYFNPMQDRTGLSPIAPLRLSADMARDAAIFNRQTFKNGGVPDFILFAMPETTDTQIEAYYDRWEKRYSGPTKPRRPAILAGASDMKPLAFSQREMEYLEGLRWSLEEASRVYGVPQPMIGSLREATLANVEALERILWRTTMVPEAQMLAAVLTHKLLPNIGYQGYEVAFDFSTIDALTELEEPRLKREIAYLDRGVLTINEVRASRGLAPVAYGNDPNTPTRRAEPAAAPTSTASELRPSLLSGAHNGEHPLDGRSP